MALGKLQLLATAFFACQLLGAPEPQPAIPLGAADQEAPLTKEDARKEWETMPPERREQFRKNFERWKNMPEEARQALRRAEQQRRRRLRDHADRALNDSKLQLDEQQSEAYKQRYIRERIKIEKALREELEAKRKPLLEELSARLKKDFQSLNAGTDEALAPSSPDGLDE